MSQESTPCSFPEAPSVIFSLLVWCRDVKKATRLGSEGEFQGKMAKLKVFNKLNAI